MELAEFYASSPFPKMFFKCLVIAGYYRGAMYRNAFAAYEAMEKFSPTSSTDLLKAHKLFIAGLVEESAKMTDQTGDQVTDRVARCFAYWVVVQKVPQSLK